MLTPVHPSTAIFSCTRNVDGCTRRVAELREGLVEEGRRRRQLNDERRFAAQSELRRVVAESLGVEEKEVMLRLLIQVCAVQQSPDVPPVCSRNFKAAHILRLRMRNSCTYLR